MIINRFFRKQKMPKSDLVKVYSHPRSGTHFLEAFLAENFYPHSDLLVENVTWGHWSDRRTRGLVAAAEEPSDRRVRDAVPLRRGD